MWLAIAILAICVAAAWVVARSTTEPRYPRVLLVGLDGADPAIIDRLIAQGRLPTIARLRREGAFGRLRSREPLLSPIIWTTIATGRKPQDHGVLDFVEITPEGRTVPITSSQRRAPALWNIATEYGHSSGFIGWYASFPVEPVLGFEISDRIGFHQVRSAHADTDATFPAELAPGLTRRLGEPVNDLASVRSRFTAGAAPLSVDGEQRLAQLARMYATTDYYRRAAIWLQARYRPELLGVYFEFVDACSHLFMEDAPPRRAGVADADYDALSQTVDRCYGYQDDVLADIVGLAGEDTLIVIVSDHGFKSGDRRPDTSGRADVGQAALWHVPKGVVLLRGPSVPHGAAVNDASILDIAPTILRALGIPLSRELPGRPVSLVIDRSRATSKLATTVAKYQSAPVPPAPVDSAEAPEKLAELHALGYISGSSEGSRRAYQGRGAPSFVNEGIALYVDGEYADALRAFGKAVELDPQNVYARVFAARIHIERRDLQVAARLLEQAGALDPRSAYVRLLRANLAITSGDLASAERELDAAAALDARLPMLYVQRARLLNSQHRPTDALQALARAEALTDAEPMLLDIAIQRADALIVLNRPAEADAALQQALSLSSAEQVAAASADVALTRHDSERAIAILRTALAKTPRSAHLWALLGATYGRSEDLQSAIAAYERSVSLEPTALSCKTLAALVFEVRHDRARAITLWEQSLALDRHQPDVEEFLRRYGFSR